MPNKFLICLFLFSSASSQKISSIEISGNKNFSTQKISSLFRIQTNDFSSKEKLEENINSILSFYENNGYPFAIITIDSIVEIDSSLKIFISIDEGTIVYVENFLISESLRTKKEVIFRGIKYKKGEIYNQSKVEKIPKRLRKLEIFSNISDPKFLMTKDGGVLQIDLIENNFTYVEGLLGFSQNKKKENVLFGKLDFSHKNLFGTGRSFFFHFEKENNLTQEIAIKYIEPYIFQFPLHLETNLKQKIQDSIFTKNIFGIGIVSEINDEISLKIGLKKSEAILKNKFTNNILETEFNSKFDYRDDFLFPKNGFSFEIGGSFGKKKELNTSMKKVFFELKNYIGKSEKEVFFSNIRGSEILSDSLDTSDLIYIGGASTMRGARENEFVCDKFLLLNLEYQIYFSNASYIFPFFDIIYFENKNESEKIFSYGIGTQFQTPIGIFFTSLAFRKNLNFENGKIHFGIKNNL